MNPLKTVKSGIQQAVQSAKEVREAKKIEKQRLCKVMFLDRNNRIIEYIGKLSPDMKFLSVENLDRLFIVDRLYYDKNFNPVAFVSLGFHRSIDLDSLSTLSDQTVKLLKSDNAYKTIDLSEFDNPVSVDFSVDNFTIIKSKAFEFLEDIPKRTIYFVLLIGILLGMFLGSVVIAWLI